MSLNDMLKEDAKWYKEFHSMEFNTEELQLAKRIIEQNPEAFKNE